MVPEGALSLPSVLAGGLMTKVMRGTAFPGCFLTGAVFPELVPLSPPQPQEPGLTPASPPVAPVADPRHPVCCPPRAPARVPALPPLHTTPRKLLGRLGSPQRQASRPVLPALGALQSACDLPGLWL